MCIVFFCSAQKSAHSQDEEENDSHEISISGGVTAIYRKEDDADNREDVLQVYVGETFVHTNKADYKSQVCFSLMIS